MNQTTNYELSLYEGTDLFNPLTVENVNFSDLDTIIKAISDRAFSAATELLTGTVHAITRADSDCAAFIFPATANYSAGETFTVDGVQVTALLPSGTTLPTGAYVIGSNVLCVLNGTLMTVFCDAGSDAQTLQGHAASYFATDEDLDTLSGTVSNLSTKVGSAVLTTTAPDCSGAINELNGKLTDMGKSCSSAVQAPTTANTYVDVTVTDPNHSVWVIKCGRRSGWNTYLLGISSIRWLTTQTDDGEIQIQGISDNVLRVTYGFAATASDYIQVYALK